MARLINRSKRSKLVAVFGRRFSEGKRLAMGRHKEKQQSTGATVLPFALVRNKAEEPYIQGDLAGMAHLLEQTLSTASTAHAIALRRRGAHPILGDPINSLQVEALDQLVEKTAKAEDAAERALRDTVAAIPVLSRSYRPRAKVIP